MSMYVDVLSEALRTKDGGLTGDALVSHVVESRRNVLSARVDRTLSAYDLLAAEAAYDLSLIRLCNDLDILISVADFANPLTERARIERKLAESRGLDLSALSRARRQT
jgi:hypothetical protein